jgi:hypothetical protein
LICSGRIGGRLAEEVAHVRAAAGDAKQSRLPVYQSVELRWAHSLFLQQVQQHAGIQIPGARAHHQAAGGGKAHRRID